MPPLPGPLGSRDGLVEGASDGLQPRTESSASFTDGLEAWSRSGIRGLRRFWAHHEPATAGAAAASGAGARAQEVVEILATDELGIAHESEHPAVDDIWILIFAAEAEVKRVAPSADPQFGCGIL